MMAKRIAQFHKVSFEQFAEGFQDTFGEMKEGELKEIYQSIKLPNVQRPDLPDMISIHRFRLRSHQGKQ